jgi:hypothetical protein
MNKITKKTIKRIKKGSYDDLIQSIEFLIDSFDEDKFDVGYKSALSDLEVRSHSLARYINEHSEAPLKVDQLAEVISRYFMKAIIK